MEHSITQQSFLILIADDNQSFRQTVSNFIKSKFKKSEIVEISDGQEAVNTAIKRLPDLIILDIDMPGLSGFQVTQILKKEIPFVPVIIITNYDENEYRIESKKVMADAFILKKNIVAELPEVMNALLSMQIVK